MSDIHISPWPGFTTLAPEPPPSVTVNGSFNIGLVLSGTANISDVGASAVNFLRLSATVKTYEPDPLWLKSVVPQFIPASIFEGYPRFVELLEQFCDTIEKRYDENNNESIGAYYPIKYFDQLVDLDDTRDDLLEWFKRTFAVTIPQFTSADTRLLIKNAVRFYVSRGTKDSIKFLLNTFYGDSTATVYEPKVDLLRASDGTWYQPYLIALTDFSAPLTPVSQFVLQTLYDQELINETTLASGYVGLTQSYSGTPVVELIDKFGKFLPGDILRSNDGRQWIVHTLGLVKLPGTWLTTDSFLSSDKRLQDNFYWQDFSYEISTQRTSQEISEAIQKNTHPAGLLNFVKTKIISYVDWLESLDSFSTLTIKFGFVDTDVPSTLSTSTSMVLIDDYSQSFTDWSEFIQDLSAGYNLSNDVTLADIDYLIGADIDIKSSQSHILFNWGQRFATPYLVPGQSYVAPIIDEAVGQAVRVSLEDFPMTEYEDVPLEYLERVQIFSVSNHSGFETFTLNDTDEKVFFNSGTAFRLDRRTISVIAGKPSDQYTHLTLDEDSDTGYMAGPFYPGSDDVNFAVSVFPNSNFESLVPFGIFCELNTKNHNAIVFTSTGQVLFSGYDYHITDDYLVIDPKYIGKTLHVQLFDKCQVTPINYSACFNSWYNSPKPLENTFLDFVKSTLEII